MIHLYPHIQKLLTCSMIIFTQKDNLISMLHTDDSPLIIDALVINLYFVFNKLANLKNSKTPGPDSLPTG